MRRQRQLGMTLIGMLFVLAMAGVIVYAGIRLTPVYLNYMKVVSIMNAAAGDSKGENPDLVAIRRSLDKHWEIVDIDSVSAKDIEIQKDDGGVTLHVAYDDSTPYLGNVSLTAHFDKTVKVQ
jgi:hypothetical protein